MNFWVNGEFANQLDLKTYEYATLAELFSRDVTTAKPKEYLSPDGSLFLPAGRASWITLHIIRLCRACGLSAFFKEAWIRWRDCNMTASPAGM